jgi:hypothetical protein
MIIIDTIIFGGLTYSIFGNAYKNYMNKEKVMNDIEKLEGKTEITHISGFKEEYETPLYINMTGFMIPMGGGNKLKEYTLLTVINNERKRELLYSKCCTDLDFYKHYINDLEELDKFLKEKSIEKNRMPVSFPLAVYNKTFNQPIYQNGLFLDDSKNKVYRKTIIKNRLPLTFTVLGCCILYTAFSWHKYKTFGHGYIYGQYPIFHPKRYRTKY